jgi:serine/threonine-protein phosphatase 5
VGFSFGPDITKTFLRTNDLKLLVRSHEMKADGYVVDHDGKCVTIFSAPNYCDQMGNMGAFITFSEENDMEPQFTQFSAVPHPNVPPMAYAGMGGGQFGL